MIQINRRATLSKQEKYLDEEAVPKTRYRLLEKYSDEKPKTELIKSTIDPGFYVQHTARGDLNPFLRSNVISQHFKTVSFKLKKTQVEGFFYVLLVAF